MMFLGIAMLVTSVAAQEVREILRFTNKAVDNAYGGPGSIIRASRYGLAVVTGRGTRVNGQLVDDTVSTIYYLQDPDSAVRRVNLSVHERWPSQAVMGDSVMYVGFDSRYRTDSIYGSVNVSTGEMSEFILDSPRDSAGNNRVQGITTALSLYNGMLAGVSYRDYVRVLDVASKRAIETCGRGGYMNYGVSWVELVVFQDTSVLMALTQGGHGCGYAEFRFQNYGVVSVKSGWTTACTFTEIGDSVYWPTNQTQNLSICALSTVTGMGTCRRFPPQVALGEWYEGLAGRYGALVIPYSRNDMGKRSGPNRAVYYRLSLPDSIEYLLPVRDSSIEIIGGAWWREKFYVAVRLGEANQTVVYEIAEPAPVVSVSETKLPDGTATSHRMAFTQSRFATWIRELQDTNVEIYDVLGVRQQTSSMRPGMYAVRVGEQISVVVVTEEE
jgi:hypothetical protein